MRWVKRVAPLILSVALVVATGTIGFLLASSASSRSAALHRSDRDASQSTLASLGKQYVLVSLKEGLDYASTGTWSLKAGDPGDLARLQQFTSHATLLNYGAALVGLDGKELNAYSAGPGLPAETDPGYRPMISALTAAQPDVSSVMRVGSIPVIAMGVPVVVGGSTKAVFVGYVRLDRSALETYVESIHYGKTGKEYVVDSAGTIVAATDPADIGRSIGQPVAVNAVGQNQSGDYQRNGRLVSYAPFAVGGWSGMAVQSSSEFFGPIRSGQLRVESAIIALLAIASVVITVLGYKREAARRRFQEQLAYQAFHDSLTGLPNRPMLLERLGQALSRARRQGSAVAVLYLDLDRFKQVNDTMGHDAGDAVLVATAARLTSLVRPYDVVARMGGDEFAIVVEDLPGLLALPTARSLAERIIAEVTRPVQMAEHFSIVGVSIGVAVTDTGREDVETILRDADLAMYRAKDSRGDRFIIAGEVESVAPRTSAPQPNS